MFIGADSGVVCHPGIRWMDLNGFSGRKVRCINVRYTFKYSFEVALSAGIPLFFCVSTSRDARQPLGRLSKN